MGELLAILLVLIYTLHRLTRWLRRRGWIQWQTRGTTSSLGNAMLEVQAIFQPQMRDVLESRLEEPDGTQPSGDPPEAGKK